MEPIVKKDKDLIENVLRQATNLLAGLFGMIYKERLAKIELPSMEYCSIRRDMIMEHKILNGSDQSLEYLINVDTNSVTGRYNFKSKKPPFTTPI